MTIDERLEALTRNVELIAHAQAKNDVDISRLTDDISKLTALMADAGNFINQLAHIAQAHEHRLDRIEGQ